MSAATRDWDASTYERVSTPQAEWAEAVIARLSLRGDETILDAGCGSGRVTRRLVELVPDGHVIGVDASEAMIAHAREALGDRVTLRHLSLLDLDLQAEVDVVFSNAVFHWIQDHERLFGQIHAALRPGGTLTAQCGGFGNVDRVHEAARTVAARPAFAPHFASWSDPWNFATPEVTEERLRRAGLEPLAVGLTPRPVTPEDPHVFLRTVILGAHLPHLPEDLQDAFVDGVVRELGDPVVLDYVRLDIDARRPA